MDPVEEDASGSDVVEADPDVAEVLAAVEGEIEIELEPSVDAVEEEAVGDEWVGDNVVWTAPDVVWAAADVV